MSSALTMTMPRTFLQELVDHVFFQSTRTPSYSIVVFLFRLRSFDSGVLVIQSISHSDEEVIKKTKELVGLQFAHAYQGYNAVISCVFNIYLIDCF